MTPHHAGSGVQWRLRTIGGRPPLRRARERRLRMDEGLPAVTTPQTAAEYEAAVDEILRQIGLLNEQMRADRAESERLRAESQTLKRETRAILASMGLPV